MRFAIDYRQLNAVTRKYTYDPQTIRDKLEGSRYVSCLDVASVLVRAHEGFGHPQTAFHTPRGLYEMLELSL